VALQKTHFSNNFLLCKSKHGSLDPLDSLDPPLRPKYKAGSKPLNIWFKVRHLRAIRKCSRIASTTQKSE